MKKLSGILIFSLISLMAWSQGSKELTPTLATWKTAIGLIIPEENFDLLDTSYFLAGNQIDPNLDIAVYNCPGNIIVVLEEDPQTVLNDGLRYTKYYDLIYFIDENTITYTSYPQSFNYRIEYKGEEIFISLSYLDETVFTTKLYYLDGDLITM
ncbi:MAG: hypothetical protein JXR53_13185 [Bacteroidales bacterium]|nr:hypothetical protein [Bacteroidales bacterium]